MEVEKITSLICEQFVNGRARQVGSTETLERLANEIDAIYVVSSASRLKDCKAKKKCTLENLETHIVGRNEKIIFDTACYIRVIGAISWCTNHIAKLEAELDSIKKCRYVESLK
jgi:hypothetical protein